MKNVFFPVLFGLFFLQTACVKSGDSGLQEILAASKAPTGVVFEIASGDDEALNWAIPLVRSYSKRLRSRFPEIKLAIVSHGDELFQLTENGRRSYPDTHKQVQSLIKNQDVEVHVCGNTAASAGVDEDKFVDFVDVATTGPAQMSAYKRAGYEVLFIEKPKNRVKDN